MTTRSSLGWLRDLPDVRDFGPDTATATRTTTGPGKVVDWFKQSKAQAPATVGLPSEVNLQKFCSPIENQGSLGSCTANAGVGLLEYYENRAFGRHVDASRLFLYKTTRNLLGWTGDTGAYLRTTMKALALFGTLPESHYPYDIARYDEEPGAFDYSFAQSFQALSYFRLDQSGMSPGDVLDRVKRFLAAGYPSMFGFTVYNFGNQAGEFEYPGPNSSVQGGHAVVAVGYDDSRAIAGRKGALRVRNSWGTAWGDRGYGWLPYDYVRSGLAVDFWSLFRAAYIPTNQFE